MAVTVASGGGRLEALFVASQSQTHGTEIGTGLFVHMLAGVFQLLAVVQTGTDCQPDAVVRGGAADLAGARRAAAAFLAVHVAVSAAACALAGPLGAGRSLARGRALVAAVKAAFVAASVLAARQHPALGWTVPYAAEVMLCLSGLVGSMSSQLPFLVTAALAPLTAVLGSGAACVVWECSRGAVDQVRLAVAP